MVRMDAKGLLMRELKGLTNHALLDGDPNAQVHAHRFFLKVSVAALRLPKA